jgi:hypothetical protein
MTAQAAPEVLVCVYYRVAASEAQRARGLVREFQRGLAGRVPALRAETLVRFDLSAEALPGPADEADATLMETYRLPLTDAPDSAGAQAELRRFLHTLDAASQGLSGLLRGARHVELFAPCAS